MLLGFFADKAVNPAGANGAFLGGGWSLLGNQLLAVGATLAYSFTVTIALIWVIDRVMRKGVRVDEEGEYTGLDLTEHSEAGYVLTER